MIHHINIATWARGMTENEIREFLANPDDTPKWRFHFEALADAGRLEDTSLWPDTFEEPLHLVECATGKKAVRVTSVDEMFDDVKRRARAKRAFDAAGPFPRC